MVNFKLGEEIRKDGIFNMSRAWDIADPSSMQDACQNELSKNMTLLATSLPVAQWLERPTGVRKVMSSIPVGDSDFSLSHARDMLNIPSFLISSPSLKFIIFLYLNRYMFSLLLCIL